MANAAANSAAQPIVIPPLTAEEEDQIILARITLDERPLRRMIKKFHSYTALSHVPIVPVFSTSATSPGSLQDARDGFLLELASFELLMKKSAMICEAEARQVEEYQRSRQRLDNEHETLKSQIEELKTALEHAQMLRRRKIEYDLVAEKVNTLPTREELELSIKSLENDMTAIKVEHDTQNRTIHSQKSALDGIIAELSSLRFMGKEPEAASVPQSPRETSALDGTPAPEDDSAVNLDGNPPSALEDEDTKMHPEATSSKTPSEGLISEGAIEENDIEMGEVEEDSRRNKKKSRDDLEEGEATDASSELSEPPDD